MLLFRKGYLFLMRAAEISQKSILSLLLAFYIAVAPAYAIKDKSTAKPKSEQEVQLKASEQKKLITKISFDEVLKAAKEHSYDLKIADYQILISKQEVRGAKSEYFPKLNFMAGTEYTRNFRDIRDTTVMTIGDAFINPYTRYQSIMGVTVAYNLFDFGVRGDTLKMSKEDVKLRELETKQKLQDMNLTLLDSYTKILITSKQIEINREILDLSEKNLEMKERLFKAKDISKTELNDAKACVLREKDESGEIPYTYVTYTRRR